jgi:hypothetical protein
MFRYPRSGQGPPAPFVPSSQQQQQQQQQQQSGRSKAIAIVAPSSDAPFSDAESSSQQSPSQSGTSGLSHLSPQRAAANASVGFGAHSSSPSPYSKSKRLAATRGGGGGGGGNNALDSTSPSSSSPKAGLTARAASAAVFVPKVAASPLIQSRGLSSKYDNTEEGSGTARLMENMNIAGGEQTGYNPYANNESGRGTPNSFGGGGYETDGSVSSLPFKLPDVVV